MKKYGLSLLALLLISLALAQDAIPGVPTEYQSIVTLIVSLATGYVVLALTAICKKWFGTKGPTTVGVSAVLSLLAGFGFTAYAALAVRGDLPWTQALISAALGFVGANGAYIARVFAASSALKTAAAEGAKDPT
ncbi:hypothetical protein [Deinococcus humi]|uniref:NADPH-dependent curcumin reductase CurA n=1 Tax=Deinococcus humi TaxID=662880 RepID=A0A7W8JUU6_9DEIO|nr:hypothetical protein [Deinococcus humi]MBB5362049.1 NADPH-dependent curcumin reductase CurA [Deinococcus humi]GGO22322.1 hypothetical protein GCM10008949_09460 [Deinococcus humi]